MASPRYLRCCRRVEVLPIMSRTEQTISLSLTLFDMKIFILVILLLTLYNVKETATAAAALKTKTTMQLVTFSSYVSRSQRAKTTTTNDKIDDRFQPYPAN